jgi:hypothetical protein
VHQALANIAFAAWKSGRRSGFDARAIAAAPVYPRRLYGVALTVRFGAGGRNAIENYGSVTNITLTTTFCY